MEGLDRTTVTKVRVNQCFFRSLVLAGYQSRCAICELPFPSLLVASHIVPWSVDPVLRMHPRNGICLCTLHDKAYDAGLLVVSPDYTISIAPEVTASTNVSAVAANFTRFIGQTIKLPDRWLPDPSLLDRHIELAKGLAM